MSSVLFDKKIRDLALVLTVAEIDVIFALKRRGPLTVDDIPSKAALKDLISKDAVAQLSDVTSLHFDLTELGHKLYALHTSVPIVPAPFLMRHLKHS